MTTYEFHPFIDPGNEGKIVFPDFNTIMERSEVTLSIKEKKEAEKEEFNIDDLSIDFAKMKLSRGRQTKTTGGYSHEELKNLGKNLKKRGANVEFKSKETIIDSILLLE